MSDADPDNTKLVLAYASENRKSEIALLWSRALYFWGFIAALLVLYGVALQNGHRTIALCAACLGSLCSLCWTFTNRSSKYWQEVWEKKTESAAEKVKMDNIFPRGTNPDICEYWIWGPKQFSPSKLAIAVSDLIFIGWIVLVLAAVVPRLIQFTSAFGTVLLILANLAVILAAAAYGFAIFLGCRSGRKRLTWAEYGGTLIVPINRLRKSLINRLRKR